MRFTLIHGTIHYPLKIEDPKTSLFKILADFCEKQNPKLDLFEHELRQNRVKLHLESPINILDSNSQLYVVKTRARSGARPEARIAVQLEDGTRLQGKFPSSMSLWDLLVHLGQEHGRNITQRTVVPDDPTSQYICPIIKYQRVEIDSIERLKTYTLAKLGLADKGGCVLRLAYKDSDMTFAQVLEALDRIEKEQTAKLELKKRQVEQEKQKLVEEQKSQRQVLVRSQSQSSLDIAMGRIGRFVTALCKEAQGDEFNSAINTLKKVTSNLLKPQVKQKHRTLCLTNNILHERCLKFKNAVKYLECLGFMHEGECLTIAPANDTGAIFRFGLDALTNAKVINTSEEKIPDIPRESFVTHVDDVARENSARVNLAGIDEAPDFDVAKYDRKLLQQGRRDDKRLASELNPQVLISREKIEQMKVRRKYEKTIIRVQFPSKLIVQGNFHPNEKLSAVMEFIRGFLKDQLKEKHFVFFVKPNTTLGNPEATLRSAGLVPAALVYFRWPQSKKMESITVDNILHDDVKALRGQAQVIPEVPTALNHDEKPTFQMDLSKTPLERKSKRSKRSGGGGPKWFGGR